MLGIGSVHARIGDILAYLFTWTITFILKPSGIAVLTLTFAQYFLSGVMDGERISRLPFALDLDIHLACGPPEELVKMLAILAICRRSVSTRYTEIALNIFSHADQYQLSECFGS
jgi:RsiW-degrading membrane proteinase PrsW (M82 family)